MCIIKPSITRLRADFSLEELLETISNIRPWLADLAWNIKYVPVRLNPRLNKKSAAWSFTFPSQVVGRCRDTICDVWGAKEDAGNLAARTATPRACCSLAHISFTLWGHQHVFYYNYKLRPRTPDSFLLTHTHIHSCTVSQKSHFRTVQLATTAIKVQVNWKGSVAGAGTAEKNITCKQISISLTPCPQI